MIKLIKNYHFPFAISFAVITLLVMIFSHSRKDYDYELGVFFSKITSPIAIAAKYSADSIIKTYDTFVELQTVRATNLSLQNEIKQLKTQNLELQQKLQNYNQLQRATNYIEEKNSTRIYAKVIAEVQNDYSRLFIINRGSKDGVSKNQGVVSYDGVVGKIIRTSENEALVQLITDIQSKIPVLIEKSKTRSLIQGDGQNSILLQSIPREENIEVGDKIVTTEVTSVFPGNFLIGTIESVYKKEFGWFQEAKIKTAVDLYRVEDLFILPNTAKDKALKIITNDNDEY